MTQDILVLILPYLSTSDATALFEFSLSEEVLTSPDNAVQKRGYKILAKLVESHKAALDVEIVIKRLDDVSEHLTAAAKKVNILWSIFFKMCIMLRGATGSLHPLQLSTTFDPADIFTCYPLDHTRGGSWHKGAIGKGQKCCL